MLIVVTCNYNFIHLLSLLILYY